MFKILSKQNNKGGINMENRKAQLIKQLKAEISTDELLEIVQTVNLYDGNLSEFMFYDMYMLDDLFSDCKPTLLLEKLSENFNVSDDYFYDEGKGKLESFSGREMSNELIKNLDEIVDTFVENVECYIIHTRLCYDSTIDLLVEIQEINLKEESEES